MNPLLISALIDLCDWCHTGEPVKEIRGLALCSECVSNNVVVEA